MPIEVTVKLDRDSAIYLAGETIQCKVALVNIDKKLDECLAWGSCHLQCERIMRTSKELMRNESDSGRCRSESTSISRSVFTVFSCRPVILFCELLLKPGERQEFECSQELPLESIPSSFKGHLIRYIYKLTVGVQHVKSPIKLLNIPLRVIQSDLGIRLPPAPKHANPFLINHSTEPSIIDLTTEMAETLTSREGGSTYSIKNSKGKIATFYMLKKAFKLGEDIIGRFIFDDCAARCLQYTASLQSVETLVSDDLAKPNPKYPRHFCETHVTEHATCSFMQESVMRIHIPLSVTPTFRTDTVQLKWRLYFEFVTCDNFNFTICEGLAQAPESLNIERMCWNLDIKIFPCSPHNAALTAPNPTATTSMIV